VIPVLFGVALFSWSLACLSHAWARWQEAKYWAKDDDDGGGDQPVTPYDIDPQRDPGDWWKHDQTPPRNGSKREVAS
jgi:hypothetical protein